NVGDLLELQSAFQRDGIVDVPSDVDEVFVSVQLAGKYATVRVACQCLLDELRQASQSSHRRCACRCGISPGLRDETCEQVQHRQWRGETLGGGNRNFLAGTGQQCRISVEGQGSLRDVANRQRLGPFAVGYLERGDGVDGSPRLGKEHREFLRSNDGVAI